MKILGDKKKRNYDETLIDKVNKQYENQPLKQKAQDEILNSEPDYFKERINHLADYLNKKLSEDLSMSDSKYLTNAKIDGIRISYDLRNAKLQGVIGENYSECPLLAENTCSVESLKKKVEVATVVIYDKTHKRHPGQIFIYPKENYLKELCLSYIEECDLPAGRIMIF